MSGLRQQMAEPMPNFEILKLYKDLGGEIITIGSDATE
jgi:histidinol-phosphatase (PHP family)